jgi:hypothetical protein
MLRGDGGFFGDEKVRLGAVGFALLLVGVVVYLRFDYEVPMPPPPPRPKPDQATLRSLDFNATMYRASLEKDASDYGVPAPTPEDMAVLFPYDVAEPRQLLGAGTPPIQTRDLLLSVRIGRTGEPPQDHIILRIENRTDGAVAYRVDTRLEGDARVCLDKSDLPHNAIALAPHDAVERTECTTHNGALTAVTVMRVETLAIPSLSYFYVSRLFPPHIGLDARPTRHHVPPKGAICTDIPEQAIRRGLERGEVSWRDVIDFYARESCAKFIFPVGYRAFTRDGAQSLPVPLKGPASAP